MTKCMYTSIDGCDVKSRNRCLHYYDALHILTLDGGHIIYIYIINSFILALLFFFLSGKYQRN